VINLTSPPGTTISIIFDYDFEYDDLSAFHVYAPAARPESTGNREFSRRRRRRRHINTTPENISFLCRCLVLGEGRGWGVLPSSGPWTFLSKQLCHSRLASLTHLCIDLFSNGGEGDSLPNINKFRQHFDMIFNCYKLYPFRGTV
jgi:hypothetical protein